MITLVTERLLLRPWDEADEMAYTEMAQDASVMQFVGAGETIELTAAVAQFEASRRLWAETGLGPLAIEPIEDLGLEPDPHGLPLGMVTLGTPTAIQGLPTAVELRCRLRESAWGQGVATEASSAIMSWAFEDGEVESLCSIVHPANEAAISVAKKLGMTVARRTVVPEHQIWVEVFGITAEEWRKSFEAGAVQ